MSFFFGRDLWDEMDRVNSQIAQLSQSKDKKGDYKVESYSYFFPPSDVIEKEDSYVIAIDLPGVRKEDITMDLHQNKLSVSGTRKPRYLPEEKAEEKEQADKMEEDDEIVADKKPEEKKEGEKAEEPPKKKEETEKVSVLSCKCGYGQFKRVFTVPAGCQPEDIAAKMEDGVLYITIQKPKVPEPRRITVM
jgi:HSP20 family molecular chaperone IbpA